MIDLEIIKAIGISLSFFGIMLSIVVVGLAFLKCKTSKEQAKEFLKMAFLISSWSIFILFSVFFCKICAEIYNPIFLQYSLMHIITTLIGVGIIIMWVFMFSTLSKVFNKKLLIWAGIIAIAGILERLIFVFYSSHYFMLINRITIIIPLILGFFMIIQSSTGERTGVMTKMIKSIYVILAGIILILLFNFGFSYNITGEVISNKITGEIISGGELGGLELSVVVPEKYQNIRAGEMLQFKIELKNIEKAGRHDVQLDYYIKKNDITLAHRRELKAIETQASFLSSIKVPEETLPGLYNIEVQINEEESSIEVFYVKSSEVAQIRTYLILLIVAIIVVGGMISWQLHKLTKRR